MLFVDFKAVKKLKTGEKNKFSSKDKCFHKDFFK